MTTRTQTRRAPVARTPRAQEGSGWLRHAGWLCPDVLLALGWLPDAARARAGADVDGVRAAAVSSMRYGERDAPGPVALLIAFDAADPAPARGERLTVRLGKAEWDLDLAEAGGLQALLAEGLAWLDAASRAAVLAFLVEASAPFGSRELSAGLATCRDALRERLPASRIDPAGRNALHIEVLADLGETAFYIEGWMWHSGRPLARLTAVSPEGRRVELLPRLHRYERRDISSLLTDAGRDAPEKAGFVCYFETEEPVLVADGWVVELEDAAGIGVECRAPAVSTDAKATLAMILNDLALERLPAEGLRITHLRPAISHLLQRQRDRAVLDEVETYGEPPAAPEASIIVPLYGRIDFLEHQLAQFVHDPDIRAADLIYVLDSPELADWLRQSAAELFRLYHVPFRTAALKANGGFAVANNIAAGLATGRRLVLMNSDVLPARPGWLGDMLRFYEQTPRIGALAPKLIYEDDSLQHAGLYFGREEGSHTWANEHFFKGLHKDLPAANVSRPVPAVTAACMMIDRELFMRLGGLRHMFVQGDYEDSDLCLRLAEEGYETWYLASVELYHLEGQSYPSELRRQTWEYNRWLHTHLWSDPLAERGVEGSPPRHPDRDR